MNKVYEIKGKSKINGTINMQGSKNSSLAIIVASILCKDVVMLKNIPKIQDVYELIEILKKINVKVSFIDNSLLIDSTNIKYTSLLFKQIIKFRASYYFIGAFLSLFKKVEIYMPGGCKIGNRPMDQHIKAFNELNVNINIDNNKIIASTTSLIGNEIVFDVVSVGATVNAILASVFANNSTILKNVACEPEISDLIEFLNKMGAKIIGKGTSVLYIEGVNKLNGITYEVMPDRIVTGTYLIYGALLAKKLTIKNINSKDNYSLINTLINLGTQMDIKEHEITIYGLKEFEKANIKTDVFPSFPSDLQQIMTTFLFMGKQISLVEETLFENRFSFLKQIKKMGGKFFIYDNKVLIIPSLLKNSIVSCEDLRGGAALLLACMASDGTSILKNVEYIERGYEDIVNVLKSINVDIKETMMYEA